MESTNISSLLTLSNSSSTTWEFSTYHTVLGILPFADINITTGILCAFMVVLILVVAVAKSVVTLSIQSRLHIIVSSLLQQLCVIGFTSYLLFIASMFFETNNNNSSIVGDRTETDSVGALRFTNLMILFMSVSLLAQTFQSIRLILSTNTLLRWQLMYSALDILHLYDSFKEQQQEDPKKEEEQEGSDGGDNSSRWSICGRLFGALASLFSRLAKRVQLWLLYRAPSWVEVFCPFPSIRSTIELKVLDNYFHQLNDVPTSLSFPKYVEHCGRTYAARLVSFSPLCWLVFACMVALNFIRNYLIMTDRSLYCSVLDEPSTSASIHAASDAIASRHRALAMTAEHGLDCDSYIVLCFAAVLLGLLSCALFVVFGCACRCYEKLVEEALAVIVDEEGEQNLSKKKDVAQEVEDEELSINKQQQSKGKAKIRTTHNTKYSANQNSDSDSNNDSDDHEEKVVELYRDELYEELFVTSEEDRRVREEAQRKRKEREERERLTRSQQSRRQRAFELHLETYADNEETDAFIELTTIDIASLVKERAEAAKEGNLSAHTPQQQQQQNQSQKQNRLHRQTTGSVPSAAANSSSSAKYASNNGGGERRGIATFSDRLPSLMVDSTKSDMESAFSPLSTSKSRVQFKDGHSFAMGESSAALSEEEQYLRVEEGRDHNDDDDDEEDDDDEPQHIRHKMPARSMLRLLSMESTDSGHLDSIGSGTLRPLTSLSQLSAELGTSVGKGQVRRSITNAGKLGLTAALAGKTGSDIDQLSPRSNHSALSLSPRSSPRSPAIGTTKSTIHKDEGDVHDLLSDAYLSQLYFDCLSHRSQGEHYRVLFGMTGYFFDWIAQILSYFECCCAKNSKNGSNPKRIGNKISRTHSQIHYLNNFTKEKSNQFIRENYVTYKTNKQIRDSLKTSDASSLETSQSQSLPALQLAMEVLVACQSLYIVFWAAQLIPLTTSATYCISWIFVLTIPIVLNVRLIHCIYHRFVLLQSVYNYNDKANRDILLDVLNELIIKETAYNDLRTTICGYLINENIDTIRWKAHIQVMCNKFGSDQTVLVNGIKRQVKVLNQVQFRMFLESLEIFIDIPTFLILWESIDRDFSNTITWDEIYLVAFPEFQRHFKSYVATTTKIFEALDHAVVQLMQVKQKHATRESFLIDCYEYFDPDRQREHILKQHVDIILTNLGVELSELEKAQLFAFVGISSTENIVSWKCYWALFDPTNSLIDRVQLKPVLRTVLMPSSVLRNTTGESADVLSLTRKLPSASSSSSTPTVSAFSLTAAPNPASNGASIVPPISTTNASIAAYFGAGAAADGIGLDDIEVQVGAESIKGVVGGHGFGYYDYSQLEAAISTKIRPVESFDCDEYMADFSC